jgi:hypothetical protein
MVFAEVARTRLPALRIALEEALMREVSLQHSVDAQNTLLSASDECPLGPGATTEIRGLRDQAEFDLERARREMRELRQQIHDWDPNGVY